MNKISTACIIDDDPIIIYGTKRMMQELQFSDRILVFNNGKDAIDAFLDMIRNGEDFPEVIFLDLNMPVMNGWEFLDNFIRLPSINIDQTSINIISSSIDPRDHERVKEYSQVHAYILKPVSQRDLRMVMESHTQA